MKKVTLLAASVLAAAMMAPVANAYTPNAYFGGYFRAGVNHGNGGQMAKFNVNKVGRLGNENDNYGEIFLGADVAQVDDTVWTVNSRLTAMSNNGKNADWQGNDKNDIALREFNLAVKGMFDWDKDAVIWAGKRFYKREDIHITDMYYYDISGYGAGIEDLQVGPGKLSAAWLRQDDSSDYLNDNEGSNYRTFVKSPYVSVEKYKKEANVSLNKFDVRYNFGLWDGASLQVSDTYYMPETQNGSLQATNLAGKVANANTFGLELNIGHSMGWNKTVFQWMHGSNADGVHYGTGNRLDYTGLHNSANGWRLMNFGDTNFTDTFKVQHVVNIAHSNRGGMDVLPDHSLYLSRKDKTTYSVVIRPFLQLTKMTRLIWEAGAYYDVENYDGLKNTEIGNFKQKEKGQKLTMAYALTPDASNVWSRPEIRFFVSYIHGNVTVDGDKQEVNLTSNEGKSVNHNIMFGVQAEAWW